MPTKRNQLQDVILTPFNVPPEAFTLQTPSSVYIMLFKPTFVPPMTAKPQKTLYKGLVKFFNFLIPKTPKSLERKVMTSQSTRRIFHAANFFQVVHKHFQPQTQWRKKGGTQATYQGLKCIVNSISFQETQNSSHDQSIPKPLNDRIQHECTLNSCPKAGLNK